MDNSADNISVDTVESVLDFNEYAEGFKSMLVKRYNWTVTDASLFEVERIRGCFEKGFSKYKAYWTVFEVEPDLEG